VARGEHRPDSDVDLLADFPPGLGLSGLGLSGLGLSGLGLSGLSRLRADLEGMLRTRVGLIPAAGLEPGVREGAGADLIAL